MLSSDIERRKYDQNFLNGKRVRLNTGPSSTLDWTRAAYVLAVVTANKIVDIACVCMLQALIDIAGAVYVAWLAVCALGFSIAAVQFAKFLFPEGSAYYFWQFIVVIFSLWVFGALLRTAPGIKGK
jgi:hypothetical protein